MASIYETHKPSTGEGGGLYLKIADGETVKLRIASEPAIFEQESKPDENGNIRISTRYGWVVWNQEEKKVQILQQSATFFKNIAALAQDEEWGDPTGYDIKVSRKGSSFNDTTYTITPSNNREPLDSEAKEAISAINLIEKLEASPFSQRVMWLTEAENPGKQPAAKTAEKSESAGSILNKKAPVKKDSVIEDIGDEPINLDDIPFD